MFSKLQKFYADYIRYGIMKPEKILDFSAHYSIGAILRLLKVNNTMKKTLILAALCLFAVSAFADNGIIGRWKDKSEPTSFQYEFKKGNEFIYTHKWNYEGKTKTRVYKGVWEIGAWSITRSSGTSRECNLTLYAGTEECCFNFKFIGDNLILTNEYRSNSYGDMCKNRVLIKSE
ncbi:MAG: hypothetical protein SRB2_03872 [Desulfobacteraceae bacterium Eth-SRB2]|nr:MAG: hypothetical protein SRB2_03872 [Desulfobacteraceae bacterium Eth-SRB2]